MTWEAFKVLFPSMFFHFVLSLVVFTGIWYFLKKTQSTLQFHLFTFLAFGGGLSVWHSMSIVFELKQNQKLIEWQEVKKQEDAAAAQAALPGNNPNLTVGSEEELKVRQQFVQILDQAISNPQQVTEQTRQQIYNSFKGIYGNPQLVQFYKSNLANFVLCTRAYLNDAAESMTQKKEVRSKDQQQCATLAGDFFNRPKLLEDNFMQVYNTIISSAGRAPASKKDLPKLEDVKASLQRQEVAIKVIKFLFP